MQIAMIGHVLSEAASLSKRIKQRQLMQHVHIFPLSTGPLTDSNIVAIYLLRPPQPPALRIRNTCIDKTLCDSAKQTARLTFTTVTKAFMVLII